MENIKEFVYNQCDTKECGGKFTTMEHDGDNVIIKDCKCYDKLVKYHKYNEAGIPDEFFNFDVEDIAEDFDKKILDMLSIFTEKIKMCMVNKAKFWFYGINGRGKTTISVLMLKRVLEAGYTGKIIKAFELLKYLYNGDIEELDVLDFLVVDELDKLTMRDNQIMDFSNIVTDYMDKKSMIFVTNKSVEDIKTEKIYPVYFIDRLDSFEKVQFKSSRNYRKGKSVFAEIKDVK